jgi:ectoine hydroxylase-related dioxygenase (phytanoyl-CoA dioxygenase family)
MQHFEIPAEILHAFEADGAVCLRRVLDAQWISRLQGAADRIINGTGTEGRLEFTASGRSGRYVSDLFLWRHDPVFRALAFESPLAAVAGQLLRSGKINFLFDHLLCKEPGTADPTKWHQDLPYWPIAGNQVLSIWIALDPVSLETGGVEYVRGSHRWPERYRPVMPSAPEFQSLANMDLPECPSFHRLRDRYEIISWTLEAGDCIAFHALTIHGSGGNSSSTLRRRGLATRWTGDDVTYRTERHALVLPVSPQLAAGAPLDSELFPVVWRAAASAEVDSD